MHYSINLFLFDSHNSDYMGFEIFVKCTDSQFKEFYDFITLNHYKFTFDDEIKELNITALSRDEFDFLFLHMSFFYIHYTIDYGF